MVVDTREQKPLKLNLPTVRKKLDVGDYSILGCESEFAIERKAKEDFVKCATVDRRRFQRELERSRVLDYFTLMIECDETEIEEEAYRSKVSHRAILASAYAWGAKYRFAVQFNGSRAALAKKIERIAYYWYRDRLLRGQPVPDLVR